MRLSSGISGQTAEQPSERHALRRRISIGVDRLAQKNHFDISLSGQICHLADNVCAGPVLLLPRVMGTTQKAQCRLHPSLMVTPARHGFSLKDVGGFQRLGILVHAQIDHRQSGPGRTIDQRRHQMSLFAARR